MKNLAVIALAAFVAVGVSAQDKPAQKPDAKAPEASKPADAAKPAAKDAQAPVDPAVTAWVESLTKRITDQNQVIRDSAAAAVERVGKPALPTLTALAAGADKPMAEAAKKIIERINRPRGEGRGAGGSMAEKIAKDLNLDDAKSKKLADIEKTMHDKRAETMEAVRNGEMSREEAMAEFRQSHEDMKKEYRKFLSEEEAKKVDEAVKKAMEERMGGRGGGGRFGRGQAEGGAKDGN